MSLSGPYRDGPKQIMYEGQQISLVFTKDTPTTAKLTWNIPRPVFSCDDNTRVYNGVVITVSNTPIQQSDKPLNGSIYNGDITVDPALHAGDKIGASIVVAALYDDDVTTEFSVTDLDPNTPYYFTLYAVTAQYQYDPAGASAYSLPISREGDFKSYPAYHELRVLGPANKRTNIKDFVPAQPGSMLGQASTNLDPVTTYVFTVATSEWSDILSIPVLGSDAPTWDALVAKLNDAVALSINAPQSAGIPNLGSLYLDAVNGNLYQWSGEVYSSVGVTLSATDPSQPSVGEYRVDQAGILAQYDGAMWQEREYVSYYKPINQIAHGDVWINSPTAGAIWEGNVWCPKSTFFTVIDPSLGGAVGAGSFWYNTDSGIVHEWDATNACWKQTHAMYSAVDPSLITTQQLWYNYDTNVLSRLNADGQWDVVATRVSAYAPKGPVDGEIWINSATDVVSRYTLATNTWSELTDVIHWNADPRIREGCDLWWNASTDELFVWDFVNSVWITVSMFYQSPVDPSLPPALEQHTLWDTGSATYTWDGMDWIEVPAIRTTFDPRTTPPGTIVRTTDGSAFISWSGATWDNLVVTESGTSAPQAGQYWYDGASLRVWNGLGWGSVLYSTVPQIPQLGYQYYDTLTSKLMEWRTGRFVEAVLPISFGITVYNNLIAWTKTVGSTASVTVGLDSATLTTIRPKIVVLDPVIGCDGIPSTPMYKTQGIGTDGSVDERRELANYVLTQLGYPKVQVELTKQQVDNAIDDALEVLRLRTSAAYTRGFMVLDLVQGQQVYELSNKTQGLDRITRVMKIHRTRYGRIGAYSYEDTFGSAMIQQLYQAGSFDLLSYHLLANYNELINNIFANDMMFSWNEHSRILFVQQSVKNKERVLVEVELEKTEQELMVDRTVRNWIKKYTLGKSLLTLARIRGKFGSLPGAGGGIALNSSDLQTEGQALIEECNMDIETQIIGAIDQYGSSSLIIMG